MARRIIFDAARYDADKAEAVNLLSSVEVLGKVAEIVPENLAVSDVPSVERGEIIKDSRGKGSFQK